jgi:hypothetical protein
MRACERVRVVGFKLLHPSLCLIYVVLILVCLCLYQGMCVCTYAYECIYVLMCVCMYAYSLSSPCTNPFPPCRFVQVFVGVYGADEEIPYNDALPFQLE